MSNIAGLIYPGVENINLIYIGINNTNNNKYNIDSKYKLLELGSIQFIYD